MANGGTPSQATAQVASTGPKAATPAQSDQSKRDLTSWWKTFKRGNARPQEDKGTTFRSASISDMS